MRRTIFTLLAIASGLLTLLLIVVLGMGLRKAASVTETALGADMNVAVQRAKSGRSAWVALTDASADCKRFVSYADTSQDGETRDAALFVAVNEARNIEIVVDARDVRECRYVGNVNFVGMLKRMDDTQRNLYSARGLALPAGGIEWQLCTQCSPGGEWGAIIAMLFMTGFFAWLTLKLYRARTPADAVSPQQAARERAARRKSRQRP